MVAGSAADHVVVAADGQHVGVDPGAGRGPRVVGQRVLGVDQAHHDAPVVRVVAELHERRVGQAAHVKPGILEGQGAVDIVPPGVARRVQARKGLLDLGGRADVEVDVVARAVEGVAYVGVVLVHRRGVEVVAGAAINLQVLDAILCKKLRVLVLESFHPGPSAAVGLVVLAVDTELQQT